MPLLQSEFTDSARREEWKDHPDPGPLGLPAPIGDVSMWRAPIPESADGWHVVQAERAYSREWGWETWIFDLWVVPTAGRLEIMRRRGPVPSDPDYKGAPSEDPTAAFRYNGRTLVLYSFVGHEGQELQLAELSDHHVVELSR
jgi:hypothetical protein